MACGTIFSVAPDIFCEKKMEIRHFLACQLLLHLVKYRRISSIFPDDAPMEVAMQHLGTLPLMTDRLQLTPLRPADLESVAIWSRDPAVYEYIQAEPKTLEETQTILKRIIERYAYPSTYYWAIRLRDSERCIGCIFVDMMVEAGCWCSVDFLMDRRQWGNSYLSEALKAVIDFLIGQVGFHRVQTKTPINDHMNGHVFLKVGMLRDGVLRECFRAKDRPDSWYDVAVYSILEPEWRTLQEWQHADDDDLPTL